MRDNDGHSAGTVFLSFLFGGIVGAGLAMLLAPQSGSARTLTSIADLKERELNSWLEERLTEHIGDCSGIRCSPPRQQAFTAGGVKAFIN